MEGWLNTDVARTRPRSQIPRHLDNEISVQDFARAPGRACARPDSTDTPSPRCDDHSGGGVAGSYPHAGIGAAAPGTDEIGAVHQGGRRAGCKKSFRSCESATGGNICGRGDTFARRWARCTSRRSRPILKPKIGMRTIRDSRSPRPPSLEPAVSRGFFRRLQPHL